MKTPLRPTLLLSILTLATATASAGQVMLSQPPSQTFSLWAHASVEAVADNFVVPAGGGMALEELTFWGTWVGDGTLQADTFDVIVHQSVAGGAPFFDEEPGPVVASFISLGAVATSTGATMPTSSGPWPEYKLDIVLPFAVNLAPGEYWVELYSTGSSGSGQTFAWENAPQDAVNGAACVSWDSATPGANWSSCTPFPETDMALELRGSALVQNTGSGYCFGDTTGAACPCAAYGGPGEGCQTTGGTGATLSASGHAEIGNDSLVFDVTGGPADKPGLFYQGENQIANPIGDGILCATGNVIRYGVNPLDATGSTSQTGFEVNAAVGQTLNYQYWFRDPANACGGQFNFTGAWTVTWQ